MQREDLEQLKRKDLLVICKRKGIKCAGKVRKTLLIHSFLSIVYNDQVITRILN